MGEAAGSRQDDAEPGLGVVLVIKEAGGDDGVDAEKDAEQQKDVQHIADC